MSGTYDICAVKDIPENRARGFSVITGDGMTEFFIIKKNNHIYGYINSCPHTHVNLEWKPDEFLDLDGELIQCSTHGARFQIEDGYCVYGPCLGKNLTPVELVQERGRIKLVQ